MVGGAGPGRSHSNAAVALLSQTIQDYPRCQNFGRTGGNFVPVFVAILVELAGFRQSWRERRATKVIKPATCNQEPATTRWHGTCDTNSHSLGSKSFGCCSGSCCLEFLIRASVASSMPIPKGDITGGRGPGLFFLLS